MKMLLGFLLGANVIFSACQTSLPSSLTLKWHETRTLEAVQLEIRFEAASDSRCPINALCIWEGDGVASLSIRDLKTGNFQTIELHSNQGVGSDSKTLAGITARMLELKPFPGTPDPPKLPEGYTVTLELNSEKP
jgi:hypothetical protein